MVVGSVAFGISLGRLCDCLVYVFSCHTGGKPKLTKGQKTTSCCNDQVFPLVVVAQQNATPSVPDTEAEETRSRKIAGPFSEGFIDDDAVLVSRSTPAEKPGETLLREQHFLRLQPILEETVTLKPRRKA